MTIDELKAEEQASVNDEIEAMKKAGVEGRFRPKPTQLAILLIAIGMLGLLVQVNNPNINLAQFWWLIFFIVPFKKNRSIFCYKPRSASTKSETFSAETSLKQ